MAGDILDRVEVFYYLFGFWLFLFNSECRARVMREWKEASLLEKVFRLLDALISILVGVVLPLAIIYYFFFA